MARLRVRYQGKIMQDLQLSQDRSYVAGRREGCDILLQAEKGISREHFRLHFAEGHWQVEVLSRFGEVTADGEKVQILNLEDKSVFLLSPYEFEYSEATTSVVASKKDGVALFQGSEGDGSENGERTYVGAQSTIPHVKTIDADGETKELFKLEGGNTWVAGRDGGCDIIIRDQRVSRRQFEISVRDNQYYILDLGSVNGTLLNGSPVSSTSPTLIKSSDAISVLDNHLYFELHDPNFKARMELVKVSANSPLIPLANDGAGARLPQPSVHPMQMQMHDQYGEPASGNKKFDFEKHRVKLIAGAIALLAVAYVFSDSGGGAPPVNPSVAIGAKSSEAFKKLPPEKQILVKQTYELSKSLYMQGKYELAKSEIAKIYELVPEYEDSKDIERLATEALEISEQKRHQEALEASKAEAEEKIQKQVQECKKKVNPNYTSLELEECLSPVLQYDPENAAIVELRHVVEQLVSDKQAKDVQKQEYQAQVQRLKSLYGKAENSVKDNQFLEAISTFRAVAGSSLPDPTGLKSQANRQIASIQKTLKSKTDQYEKDAEQAYKDQKLKDAILTLRKSLEVDPKNDSAKEKIERYTAELKKQMMVLYQEGVLEESYGNVEGGENRSGAKDKWKKIMDLDIPDGDYFAKAKIKLKKYGAL